MDKSGIRARLLALEAHDLADTRGAYAAYVAGAHVETDAGAIDDQDASQAVQSRNLSEAFDGPLHDLQHKIDALAQLDFSPKSKVEPGAVVKLDGQYFVIGVATAAFDCDGACYMGLSTLAPIYAELEDRQAGESFSFRGREHRVEEVA
jgi:hypothetical protein